MGTLFEQWIDYQLTRNWLYEAIERECALCCPRELRGIPPAATTSYAALSVAMAERPYLPPWRLAELHSKWRQTCQQITEPYYRLLAGMPPARLIYGGPIPIDDFGRMD